MVQPAHSVEYPGDAGAPGAKGPTTTYQTGQIRVLWDATRCTHVANCLRALPTVFDVGARPWVNVGVALCRCGRVKTSRSATTPAG